jgi:hypothetical protein
VLLVETQALIGSHLLLACQHVLMKDLSQDLQHITALGRKVSHYYIDKVAPCIAPGSYPQSPLATRNIARKRITHLNRRPKFLITSPRSVYKHGLCCSQYKDCLLTLVLVGKRTPCGARQSRESVL